MQKSKEQWQCRIAPSLGDGFAGHPNDVWGTKDYTSKDDPTVFFGMYGLPDFCAFRSHNGKKMILWCGSDLRHFADGWWIDDKGKQRVNPKDFVPYLKKFENWVENKVEADALKKFGIKAKIAPSFLGDVKKFPKQEKDNVILFRRLCPQLCDYPPKQYYASVSGNDFKLYGWDKICEIARENPYNQYVLYGNTIDFAPIPNNVYVRGRVSQEEMDEEIKLMTGCIRLLPFEGFSEIVCKAILWGQEVISEIPYNYTRESLLKVINKKYPWYNKKYAKY